MIHDDRACELGEGAFWHPLRQQFFWFDILNGKLMTRAAEGPREWVFDQMVSAAGWIDAETLLIAGSESIFRLALDTGAITEVCPLEADKPLNRSNDGRADRQGGFWIGTMGRDPADRQGKGAIYRLYKGELRQLYPAISIPNAICFSPDGRLAYFADTAEQTVWQVALDADGWPKAERQVYLNLRGTDLYPDGATIDAAGNFWNAQWGSSRVACYAPDGAFLAEVKVDAPHTSCPAFGGQNMDRLYVTTAMEGMTPEARVAYPNSGKVFAFDGVAKGLPEPRFEP